MITDLTKKLYYLVYERVKKEDLINRYQTCNDYKHITRKKNRRFCIMDVEVCCDCPYHLWTLDLYDLDTLAWLNEKFATKYYED